MLEGTAPLLGCIYLLCMTLTMRQLAQSVEDSDHPYMQIWDLE